jgi:hypothetical protein
VRLAAFLLLAAGAARADEIAAEIAAGVVFEQFHGVAIRAAGGRLGIGSRPTEAKAAGGFDVSILFTAAGQFGSTTEGLSVKEGRLGVGIRGRSGRLTLGLDAEGVLLSIARTTLPGNLLGTGLGARAVIAVDLVQFDNRAVWAGLEGSFAAIGSSDDRYLPAAQLSLGCRL